MSSLLSLFQREQPQKLSKKQIEAIRKLPPPPPPFLLSKLREEREKRNLEMQEKLRKAQEAKELAKKASAQRMEDLGEIRGMNEGALDKAMERAALVEERQEKKKGVGYHFVSQFLKKVGEKHELMDKNRGEFLRREREKELRLLKRIENQEKVELRNREQEKILAERMQQEQLERIRAGKASKKQHLHDFLKDERQKELDRLKAIEEEEQAFSVPQKIPEAPGTNREAVWDEKTIGLSEKKAKDEIEHAISAAKGKESALAKLLFPTEENSLHPPRDFSKTTIHQIKKEIYDARKSIENLNFDEAKHRYLEILFQYKELAEKDKAKVFEDIKELYDDRKHAEAMFAS